MPFDQAFARASATAARVRSRDRRSVRTLVEQVSVSTHGFEVVLQTAAIADSLSMDIGDDPATSITLTVPVRLTRTGRSIRLVHSNGRTAGDSAPDPTLLRLLVKARRWWAALAKGKVDISTLAQGEGVTASYMTRIVRLAFLSPDLVEAILAGKQGALIDGKGLAEGGVAIDWKKQARR